MTRITNDCGKKQSGKLLTYHSKSNDQQDWDDELDFVITLFHFA